MMPVKGWGTAYTGDFTYPAGNQIRTRAAMAWADNSGNDRVIWSTNTLIGVMASDGTVTDLTPAGFTTGSNSWQWGAFGQVPVGCGDEDGRIWEWDLNTANNLTAVTNAPTSCNGVLVTAERFIFALGDGGDPRSIRWCDRDDRTVWTPATTNQAGGFDLKTNGEIRFGLQMRGEALIVTSTDAWRARYVGYPDVYAFERIGSGGAVGGMAGVAIGDRAFWWGDNSFFQYSGGYVSALPCEVLDYVTADISADATPDSRLLITTWHNAEQHEVWWLYRSTASPDAHDSYVAFNYLDGHWHYGRQPCSVVVGKVPFATPIGFRDVSAIELSHDYASDPGYTHGGNWQISGGTLNLSAPGAATTTSPASSPVQAAEYMVRFTVAGRTAGSVTPVYGENLGAVSTNATHTFLATTDSVTQAVAFTSDATFDGTIDSLIVRQPVILKFESGFVYDGTAPYAETGPLEIGDGERRVHVTRVIPDEQDQGELRYTFQHREYPTSSEVTETTVSAANPTDVRFSGRQFTMKVEPVVTDGVAADWRHGVTRLEVLPGGKR